MQLLEVELHNIGPRRHFHHAFSPGITAITGENGAGKSMLFESIRWLLTGEYPHRDGKEASIFQLASPDEKAYGVLRFAHQGVVATVTRHARPDTTKDKLEFGDQRYNGSTKVNAAICELLQLDIATLNDVVIVGQDDLHGFLSKTEAQRAEVLQRLFRTAIVSIVHSQLGERLSALPALQMELSVAVAQDNLARAQQRLAEFQNVPADLSAAAAAIAENERIVSHTRQRQQLQQQLAIVDSDLQLAVQQLAGTYSPEQLSQAYTELAALATLATQCRERVSEYRQQRQAYDAAAAMFQVRQQAGLRRQQAEERLQQAQAVLATTPVPVVDPELRAKRQAAATAYANAKALLAAYANGAGVCPMCKQATPVPTESLAAAQAVVDSGELARLQAEEQSQQAALDVLAAARNATAMAEAEYQAANKAYHAMPMPADLAAPPAAEVVAEAVAVAQQHEQAWQQRVKELEDSRVLVAKLQETRDRSSQELLRLQQQLSQLPAAAAIETLPTLEQQLLQQRQWYAWAQQQHAARQQAELDARVAAQRYDGACRAAAQAAEREALREYLKNLRDVFHKDALPRAVVTRKLALLEPAVNETLNEFSTPFHIAATNDYSLRARFHDGREQPAQALSGGQKVVLSLCLRLSLNLKAVPGLQFVGLDEPTASLDKKRVEALLPFFRKLRQYAADNQLQCLIVTHEEKLGPIFDDVIHLKYDDAVSAG